MLEMLQMSWKAEGSCRCYPKVSLTGSTAPVPSNDGGCSGTARAKCMPQP